jgi:NAD(P)-dependent dehydrogenase (short-subunit alcohol dehydrogenase family)
MGALEGKTALVTGGTAGIGLAVARAYVDEGARVIIGGRRAEGAEIASEAGCEFVLLDVADEQSMLAALVDAENLCERPLDVLVLNAGIAQTPGPIKRLEADVAREVVDVNLLGVFWGLKHGPRHMNDGGSIVITSSISAVAGTTFEALYGATKAGVSSLARSGAIDLGKRGIRVNAVQPGPTWTEMNPMPERFLEIVAPLGRKGTVEDLIGLYVFLASDRSSYISGQGISVDGGLTAGTSQELMRLIFEQAMEPAT